MTPETIHNKLDAMLSEMGIETFVVIVKDPDTDKIISKQNGSTLWRLGALEVQRETALREWIDG